MSFGGAVTPMEKLCWSDRLIAIALHHSTDRRLRCGSKDVPPTLPGGSPDVARPTSTLRTIPPYQPSSPGFEAPPPSPGVDMTTTTERHSVSGVDTTTTTARQFINGKLVGSKKVSTSTSPADGSLLGRYADADEEQAMEAVAAARTAFADTDWSRDRRLRHQVLNGIADAIERRTDELVNLLAQENGKVLGEGGFELSLTVPKLRYYAALALSESGRAAEVAPGLHMSSVPEPIGLAGVIVPWNSPVVLSVRSFAPALAAGCTAVVKLPGQTGLVNGVLHEILSEVAGLPAGVLNSLTESGDEVARFLVSSKDVDVLSYTGSTRVGRQIMAGAAATLKRLSLELGGKTPMIVFDDADLDVVVPVLTKAVTTFSGQFCMPGSRILAQAGIADELRERLSKSLAAVRVGPGDDPAQRHGPDDRRRERAPRRCVGQRGHGVRDHPGPGRAQQTKFGLLSPNAARGGRPDEPDRSGGGVRAGRDLRGLRIRRRRGAACQHHAVRARGVDLVP